MSDQLLKPIQEAAYLSVNNAWRYRAILRYFYQQHEQLRYYLFPEEILDHLKKNPYFSDYTDAHLQQDLDQLVAWKNLIPRQDTRKVSSIEEFKKKKFRYQCTPYTVEIERMVLGLEKIGESFGGSLEKTLFDRILDKLLKLLPYSNQTDSHYISELSNEELFVLWEGLHGNFVKLTQNATDYLAHLQSEKIEEMMMTEAFLAYKDGLTEYLRGFMTVLQRTSIKIEAVLEKVPLNLIEQIAGKLADHYLSIPRLEERPQKEKLMQDYISQWKRFKDWFTGRDAGESDLTYLQRQTNETIRRITRFAQQLGERFHNYRSRRRDYLHLAQMFNNCQSIKEAHELAACVFGVFHTRHFYAGVKETEDIYAEIWDMPATELVIKPRVRSYREKTKTGAIQSNAQEKQIVLKEYLEEKKAEQRLIEEMIKENCIVLAKLPKVDPYIRKTLLSWITKCMLNVDWVGKTETGRKMRLKLVDNKEITLKSTDGVLRMPNYIIQFID